MCVLLVVIIQLEMFKCSKGSVPFSSDDKAKLSEEAGCGKTGTLLDIGVCTIYGYRAHITPKLENQTTKIHTTIDYEIIRAVDDKMGNNNRFYRFIIYLQNIRH